MVDGGASIACSRTVGPEALVEIGPCRALRTERVGGGGARHLRSATVDGRARSTGMPGGVEEVTRAAAPADRVGRRRAGQRGNAIGDRGARIAAVPRSIQIVT